MFDAVWLFTHGTIHHEPSDFELPVLNQYDGDIAENSPSISDVRDYWERFPLLRHEIGVLSPTRHWELLDELKRTDIERFTPSFWEFEKSKGMRLLDIGCGPGWLTVMYSQEGAQVTAVDLTETAVSITESVLRAKLLRADVRVANAEALPFDDSSFDIVVSSGVLHHIPDTTKGLAEALRVTVPGGAAKITLYRLSILHHPLIFPIVRGIMRMMKARHPGADLAIKARSVTDFIRMYDGEENPIGIARTTQQWCDELELVGWTVVSSEVHYFPVRMVPLLQRVPRWIHYLLDRYLGTMVFFTLQRPRR